MTQAPGVARFGTNACLMVWGIAGQRATLNVSVEAVFGALIGTALIVYGLYALLVDTRVARGRRGVVTRLVGAFLTLCGVIGLVYSVALMAGVFT